MPRQDDPKPEDARPNPESDRAAGRPRGKSMHEGVETWVDTCVCEAEPRWQAVQDRRDEEAESKPTR